MCVLYVRRLLSVLETLKPNEILKQHSIHLRSNTSHTYGYARGTCDVTNHHRTYSHHITHTQHVRVQAHSLHISQEPPPPAHANIFVVDRQDQKPLRRRSPINTSRVHICVRGGGGKLSGANVCVMHIMCVYLMHICLRDVRTHCETTSN